MRLQHTLLLLILALLTVVATMPARAQTPYIGEIKYVAFNFAPQGWLPCDGRLLLINQNQALFALIGTYYGGDGRTTFALPDMRGRVPVATGQGPGLTNRNIAETGGQEAVTLTLAQMPKHRHGLKAASGTANSKAPAGSVLANSSSAAIYSTLAPDTNLNTASVGLQGANQPHENMQPYLAMTCIIAVQGIFPTQ